MEKNINIINYSEISSNINYVGIPTLSTKNIFIFQIVYLNKWLYS